MKKFYIKTLIQKFIICMLIIVFCMETLPINILKSHAASSNIVLTEDLDMYLFGKYMYTFNFGPDNYVAIVDEYGGDYKILNTYCTGYDYYLEPLTLSAFGLNHYEDKTMVLADRVVNGDESLFLYIRNLYLRYVSRHGFAYSAKKNVATYMLAGDPTFDERYKTSRDERRGGKFDYVEEVYPGQKILVDRMRRVLLAIVDSGNDIYYDSPDYGPILFVAEEEPSWLSEDYYEHEVTLSDGNRKCYYFYDGQLLKTELSKYFEKSPIADGLGVSAIFTHVGTHNFFIKNKYESLDYNVDSKEINNNTIFQKLINTDVRGNDSNFIKIIDKALKHEKAKHHLLGDNFCTKTKLKDVFFFYDEASQQFKLRNRFETGIPGSYWQIKGEAEDHLKIELFQNNTFSGTFNYYYNDAKFDLSNQNFKIRTQKLDLKSEFSMAESSIYIIDENNVKNTKYETLHTYNLTGISDIVRYRVYWGDTKVRKDDKTLYEIYNNSSLYEEYKFTRKKIAFSDEDRIIFGRYDYLDYDLDGDYDKYDLEQERRLMGYFRSGTINARSANDVIDGKYHDVIIYYEIDKNVLDLFIESYAKSLPKKREVRIDSSNYYEVEGNIVTIHIKNAEKDLTIKLNLDVNKLIEKDIPYNISAKELASVEKKTTKDKLPFNNALFYKNLSYNLLAPICVSSAEKKSTSFTSKDGDYFAIIYKMPDKAYFDIPTYRNVNYADIFVFEKTDPIYPYLNPYEYYDFEINMDNLNKIYEGEFSEPFDDWAGKIEGITCKGVYTIPSLSANGYTLDTILNSTSDVNVSSVANSAAQFQVLDYPALYTVGSGTVATNVEKLLYNAEMNSAEQIMVGIYRTTGSSFPTNINENNFLVSIPIKDIILKENKPEIDSLIETEFGTTSLGFALRERKEVEERYSSFISKLNTYSKPVFMFLVLLILLWLSINTIIKNQDPKFRALLKEKLKHIMVGTLMFVAMGLILTIASELIRSQMDQFNTRINVATSDLIDHNIVIESQILNAIGNFAEFLADMIDWFIEQIFSKIISGDLTRLNLYNIIYNIEYSTITLYPFTANEWIRYMLIYKVIGALSALLLGIGIFRVVIEHIMVPGNAKKMEDDKETLKRMVVALIMIAIAPYLIRLGLTLFNYLVYLVPMESSNLQIGFTRLGFIGKIAKLIYATVEVTIFAAFAVRKVMIAAMFLITPIVFGLWAINNKFRSVSLWMGELFSNLASQLAYAITFYVIAIVAGYNQNEYVILILMIILLKLVDFFKDSLQGLTQKWGGINETGVAKQAVGEVKNLTKRVYSGSKKITGTTGHALTSASNFIDPNHVSHLGKTLSNAGTVLSNTSNLLSLNPRFNSLISERTRYDNASNRNVKLASENAQDMNAVRNAGILTGKIKGELGEQYDLYNQRAEAAEDLKSEVSYSKLNMLSYIEQSQKDKLMAKMQREIGDRREGYLVNTENEDDSYLNEQRDAAIDELAEAEGILEAIQDIASTSGKDNMSGYYNAIIEYLNSALKTIQLNTELKIPNADLITSIEKKLEQCGIAQKLEDGPSGKDFERISKQHQMIRDLLNEYESQIDVIKKKQQDEDIIFELTNIRKRMDAKGLDGEEFHSLKDFEESLNKAGYNPTGSMSKESLEQILNTCSPILESIEQLTEMGVVNMSSKDAPEMKDGKFEPEISVDNERLDGVLGTMKKVNPDMLVSTAAKRVIEVTTRCLEEYKKYASSENDRTEDEDKKKKKKAKDEVPTSMTEPSAAIATRIIEGLKSSALHIEVLETKKVTIDTEYGIKVNKARNDFRSKFNKK